MAVEEHLGAEFWTQHEASFGGDEVFDLMYSTVVAAFREESLQRGGSAIDFLAAERIARMYVYLRYREGHPEIAFTDRNYREMNKDVLDLLANMKKLWLAEDRDNSAEVVLKKVDAAVADALKDLPDSDKRTVERALASSFEAKGL